MRDAAQQRIAKVPAAIEREIDRIRPAALCRLPGAVLNRPGDLHCRAAAGGAGNLDVGDDQVGRGWQLDHNRIGRWGGVVAFGFVFEDLAAWVQRAGWVGDHENVLGPHDVAGQPQHPVDGVARAGGQRAFVVNRVEVAVGFGVEEGIGRQIDLLVPFLLRGWSGPGPAVGHRVGD